MTRPCLQTKFCNRILNKTVSSRIQMHQKLKKIGFLFLSLLTVLSLYALANAYVLQGPHILELMVQNVGKAKGLWVSQKLVCHDNGEQNGAVEFYETLKYVFPETFRSDILSDTIQRIQVLSNGLALTIIDGKVAAESETRLDRYKDLLLYRSRMLLEQRLSLLGVDITVSSLGRFEGKPAYVLGAQYPDESVPQIWFDKDSFRPFRWIVMCGAGETRNESLEVRYAGWHQVNRTWYPMHIELFVNDILVREIKVQDIRVNPSFTEDIFDIEYLRSTYSPGASVESDQQKTEDLNEVQKTIEEFKRIYE